MGIVILCCVAVPISVVILFRYEFVGNRVLTFAEQVKNEPIGTRM